MASFTPAELAKLPNVILAQLIPLLSEQKKQETDTQLLNRWALGVR